MNFIKTGQNALHKATLDCVDSFATTHFQNDLKKINVPTLIIHGSVDDVVPREASADRTAKAIPQADYLVYDGAPHRLFYTDKDRLSDDLIALVTGSVSTDKSPVASQTTFMI